VFKHGNRLNDFLNTQRDICNIEFDKVVENTLKVISDLGRQFDT